MQEQAYRVLARKYRPQTLSDLKGQEILATTLKKAIEENRVPHAFLFNGIRGVGKTTTARILAKALNCSGPDGKGNITCEPCGVCPSCIAVQEDRHMDVIEMDAASHTSVDDIREVIEACRYKAVQGRFKVFIIDEVHMLSKSAFNALLKTLEEPPAHVKFIFATTELRKIPDTILSRCQRFDLKRMDQQLLVNYLGEIAQKEGFTGDDLAFSILARAADGSMRDGLSLLDQAISLTQSEQKTQIDHHIVRSMLGQADRGRLVDLLESLFHGNVEAGLMHTRVLLDAGTDPMLLMQDILDYVYAFTTFKTQKITPDLGLSPLEQERVLALCQKVPVSVFLQSWQVLIKGYEELLRTPLQAQTLEMVLIRLCFVVPLTVMDRPATTIPAPTTPEQPLDVLPQNSPLDFPGLLKLLEEKKEMMIHAHLRHDVHLIEMRPGYLAIRLTDQTKNTFVSALKAFLESHTQYPWVIDIKAEGGHATVVQKVQQAEQQHIDAAKNQPVVKQILDAFPNSQVTVIKPNT
ncbi:MAG: Holliday junction ATP-dependent DNA helicase RuvB [Holosporales bacterium]